MSQTGPATSGLETQPPIPRQRTPEFLPGALFRAVLAALPLVVPPPAHAQEPTSIWVDELFNGDFEVPPPAFLDAAGKQRIPGWRSTRGTRLLTCGRGRTWLKTVGGDFATQPLALYRPLLEGLVIRGRIGGKGELWIEDGAGQRAKFAIGTEGNEVGWFELTGEELIERMGTRPMPRLELTLRGQPNAFAYWTDLEAWVALPAVSEEDLRDELLCQLDWILDLWLERGLDTTGTRDTAFLCQTHDVLTGAPVGLHKGGLNAFYTLLLRLQSADEHPAWTSSFTAFFDDYLRVGLSPETGLPVLWDAERDVAIEDHSSEISQDLAFLIDVASKGPPELRASSREAALRMGTTIVEHGSLPDGAIATRFRPRDAHADTETPPIRRLNLPAQLGRLARLTDERRFSDAAKRAFSRLEFSHHWPGSWERVDPAFDDQFGNYAAAAFELWQACPDEGAYRAFVLRGLEHFRPLWRDALQLGGYVAADEVRCWKIALDAARQDPSLAAWVDSTVHLAVRFHFKNQQYANGTWGDVTFIDHRPQSQLEVGDLGVLPRNLLLGIAYAYGSGAQLPRAELRARFAAILRSTLDRYARPYGVLSTSEERPGTNPSRGSLRIAQALTEMLLAL